jgi:hypothetical protein
MDCKRCGATGFVTPLDVAHHARQSHPSKPRKKRAKTTLPPDVPEYEPETALLINATALFAEAFDDVEIDGCTRVIAYLHSRFGADPVTE